MLTFKRLSSGYWHIRGSGPCEWCQPDAWPHCSDFNFFPEASDTFMFEVMAAYRKAIEQESVTRGL